MKKKISSSDLRHLVRKYLLQEQNNLDTQSDNYPYDELKKNPTNEFIVKILKDSNGGSWYVNDKEAWAEAAFNAIKTPQMYNSVSKLLKKDPLEYIKSFMDPTQKYHINSISNHYSKLFNITQETSCTSDILRVGNWSSLYSALQKRGDINKGEPLLIIWGPTQTLYYTTNGKTLSLTTKVSTGAGGFGNSSGNMQTSTGLVKVVGKKSARDFEVMVGKSPTGKILGPNVESKRVDNTGKHHKAEVLTGILELGGLEPCNQNIYSRHIYIHGTNRESYLGTQRSNGCIRVSNQTIKKLLNTIKVGTKVYIYPKR